MTPAGTPLQALQEASTLQAHAVAVVAPLALGRAMLRGPLREPHQRSSSPRPKRRARVTRTTKLYLVLVLGALACATVLTLSRTQGELVGLPFHEGPGECQAVALPA